MASLENIYKETTSIRKSLYELDIKLKYFMANTLEELKDLKLELKTACRDHKYFFEMQERRHQREMDRIINLCSNFSIGSTMNVAQKSDILTNYHCVDFNDLSVPGSSDKSFKEAAVAEDFAKTFRNAVSGIDLEAQPKTVDSKTATPKAVDSKEAQPKAADSTPKTAAPKAVDSKKAQPKAADPTPKTATPKAPDSTPRDGTPVSTEKTANKDQTSEVKDEDTTKANSKSPKPTFSFGTCSGKTFASVADKSASGFNFLTPNNKSSSAAFGEPAKIFPSKTPQSSNNDADKNGEESDDAEEFVPDTHFEPIIPLPALAEKRTGEEDEEVMFLSRCKLYRFDRDSKEQKERGVGEIKILKHKTSGHYRCVMRRDQIFNLCANFPIGSGMKISQKPNAPTIYNWVCTDFSDLDMPGGSDEIFTARFKEAAVAEDFAKTFRNAVSGIDLEAQPKTVDSKTATPKAVDSKEAQPKAADSTPKTAAPKAVDSKKAQPKAADPTPKTATPKAPDSTPRDGTPVSTEKTANKDQTSEVKDEDTTKANSKSPKPTFSFGTFSGKTFASVADKSASGFNFLTPNNKSSSAAFGEPAKIFPSKTPQSSNNDADKNGEESDDAEEFVPDTHFEPIIPLPALAEKRTGEEDEEVMFLSRCKLYRFDRDSKEQKERGVGEIKILKHKTSGHYRCVMRRDQIFNLCANFPIGSGMKISQKPNAPTIYNWVCTDFSDLDMPGGSDEIFTARFKEAAVAEDFAKTFKKSADGTL